MLTIILRTLFFYFFIVFVYRIMGKREIGQLGVPDLIVSLIMAELTAVSIENHHDSVLNTIIPICVLTLLEILSGIINIKSRKLNKVFVGKPTLIISKGKLIYNNLVNQRYSLDDLLLELRQNQIQSLEDVEYAFLEPNGKLSIFKYNFLHQNQEIPMPVIVEGTIQQETLKELEKNENWLLNLISKNNINKEDIFYAFYRKNHLYIIKNK